MKESCVNTHWGAAENAWLVKCLQCKHGHLSWHSNNPGKNPHVLVHICNPRTDDVETEGYLALSCKTFFMNWWTLG